METITIKKTSKGYFYKKLDDYDNKFQRISKQDAKQWIVWAIERGELIAGKLDSINSEYPEQWIYIN